MLVIIYLPEVTCPANESLVRESYQHNFLYIFTDRPHYAIGQVIHVQVKKSNIGNNEFNYSNLNVQINRTHAFHPPWCYSNLNKSQQDVYYLILEKKENEILFNNFTASKPGKYIITVYSSSSPKINSSTTFEVINPFLSSSVVMIIAVIAFFVGLITLMLVLSTKNKDLTEKKEKRPRNEKKENCLKDKQSRSDTSMNNVDDKQKEDTKTKIIQDYIEISGVLRYLLISGMVWSIVAVFVLNDVELGTHSPLGLVLRHNFNPDGQIDLDQKHNPLTDWVVNIGGDWTNNFTSGVVIPAYVIILGIIGGYLRYLSKAISKEKNIKDDKNSKNNDELMSDILKIISIYKIKELAPDGSKLSDKLTDYLNSVFKDTDNKEKASDEFNTTTSAEISQILLAPMLASVVWLVFTRGNSAIDVYLYAAISFAVGLVTKDIINNIIMFMKKITFDKK